MFVIPADGRSVPDPARGDLLPETGRNVTRNSYWLRRIASGEVIEQEAGEAPAKPQRKRSMKK